MDSTNISPQKSRGLLLIFLFFTAGLIISGIYFYISEKEIIRDDFEKKLTAVSNLKTEQLIKWRTEKFFDANTLRSNPFVNEEIYNFINSPSRSNSEKVISLLNSYIRFGEYTDAFILNSSGEIKYSTGELGYNISELDSFFTYDKPAIKDFFRSDYNKKIYIDLIVPFLINKKTFSIIVLRVDPYKYLFPLIQKWPTPNKSAETLIIRREGDSLIFLNELRHKKNTALNYRFSINKKDLSAAIAIKKNFEGNIEGEDYRGESVLANIKKVPGSPWIMITKTDNAEIYEPTEDLALFVSAIVIILILSSGSTLNYYWVKQSRKNYKLLYEADEEIRKNEELLRIILDTLPVGVWVSDSTGKIIDSNSAGKKIWEGERYVELEKFGEYKGWWLATHEPIKPGEWALARAVTKEETSLNEEIEIECFDGSHKIILNSAKPIYNPDGTLRGALVTNQDITELKRTQEAIKISQTRFQMLIENAPDGIALISPEGKFIYISPSAYKLFGYEPNSIANLNPNELTHPDDLPEVLISIGKLLNIPYGVSTITYRFRHANNEWRWLESTFTNLLKEPSVNAIIINFRDITEEKFAKERVIKLNEELELKVQQRTIQLESANKELEAFSYSVSHDLRSPLRAISGFTKILMEDYSKKLEPDIKDLLNDILKNTDDMNQLIDDLLEFSRLSRREVQQSSIDMTRLFKQSFEEFRKLEPERNINLNIQNLPNAYGDYSLIKQVVRNLISNAVKFTSKIPDALITVEGIENHSKNIYSVKDNGVGFDMKYVDKIFGVFQRLHSQAEFEGTGVGLAIVHGIINRHGGRVWTESEKDKGATFYFSLLKTTGEESELQQ